ncbi:AraC family transcriptional regulator [Vallitalea okinawensis]|uniref:AraC family transcriptional regulator n=1 Tax=Vallitalea okinawensis TaxID=2078660 RepID=UPI000CFC1F1E|nr:AraC family transcriptional regulator [Vallitalea okinawensis]
MNSNFPTITEEISNLPICLSCIGYDFEENGIKRLQGYPTYQWIQCETGKGRLILRGKEYTITPSHGMFIYPDVPHEYYPIERPWKTSWIGFNGKGLSDILSLIGLTETNVYIMKNSNFLHNMLINCFKIVESNKALWQVEVSAYLYNFLLELVKHVTRLDHVSLQQHFNRLEPVLNYIDRHHSSPFSMDHLASLIDVTPQYLCTLFKENLNLRPFEYINITRINKSKELMIKYPGLNLNELCRTVGFDSPSYFGKLFKKLVGMTPGQFRQLHIH